MLGIYLSPHLTQICFLLPRNNAITVGAPVSAVLQQENNRNPQQSKEDSQQTLLQLQQDHDGSKTTNSRAGYQTPTLRQNSRNLQINIQIPGPIGGNPRPADPTDPPAVIEAPPATSMSYFEFKYAFEAGVARDPTVEEVDAMLCLTRQFTIDRVTAELAAIGDTRPISVRAWYINWAFDAAQELPVVVSFHGDIRYADDSDFVSKDVVFVAFTLSTDDVAGYIQNYVWNVDINNVFYFTNQVDYRLRSLEPAPETHRLERSACEQTRPPTTIPVAGSPTTAPDTSPGGPASTGRPQAPRSRGPAS